MPKQHEPVKSPDLNADAGRLAAEQAKEYESVFAGTTLKFDDGSTMEIPPQPSLRMLDDDCLEAYDKLIVESESYDREEITLPERTVESDDGTKMTLPPEVSKGNYLHPYRKDGVLLSPPWEVREVAAALGPEEYARLRASKIKGRRASSADVRRIWNEQGLRLMERQKSDSFRSDSSNDLAAVAAPDSQ